MAFLPTEINKVPTIIRTDGGAKRELMTVQPPANLKDALGGWTRVSYSVSGRLGAKLGFPVGDLEGETSSRIFVYDFARFRDEQVDDRVERWGIALRYYVKVSGMSLKGDLSLPMLAASVQAERAVQSSSLSVRGYIGDGLARSIAAIPLELNVENFSDIYKKLSDLQIELAGAAGDRNKVQPELLAVSTSSVEFAFAARDALATAYAIHLLSEGRGYSQALFEMVDRAGHDTPSATAAQSVLAEVYREFLGDDYLSDDVSSAARDDAGDLLNDWQVRF